MSTKEAKDMIRSFRRMGAQHITFIGGEPLLRKDFSELVSYAKQVGMLTTTSSNALLFEKDAEWLRDLDLFICCLNGPEEVHDKLRGKGSHKKIMEALSTPYGRFATMILTRQNVGYIDYVLEMAMKHGFFVNFQPAFRNELAKVDSKGMEDMLLPKSQINETFSYIHSKKNEGFPIVNSYAAIRQFRDHGRAHFKRCYHGQLSATVDPEGNVFRCYKFVNEKGAKNGPMYGWEKAFNSIRLSPCTTCHYGCHIEDNMLFMLTPEAVINLLRVGRIFNDG